jgi:hypothetical protein
MTTRVETGAPPFPALRADSAELTLPGNPDYQSDVYTPSPVL